MDAINSPPHYTAHPSGIECIQITEHMGFCLGNAVKYIWRADLKGSAIDDLRKAIWYLEREIALRQAGAVGMDQGKRTGTGLGNGNHQRQGHGGINAGDEALFREIED